MLDIKFLRENPEVVKQNIRNKFQDQKLELVDKVIELDKENRDIKQEVEALRAKRNKISKQIGALMGQGRRDEAEERIRRIAAPQNVARHPGFRTPCAETGVCSDCNSQDRICNTRMEMLRCHPAGRVLVVLIDEDRGL